MPLTDGHGVHRRVALSALSDRQQVVLRVLQRRGPAQAYVIPFWIEHDQPAVPMPTDEQIARALQMLYELGWAEPTEHGWKAKPENT